MIYNLTPLSLSKGNELIQIHITTWIIQEKRRNIPCYIRDKDSPVWLFATINPLNALYFQKWRRRTNHIG